MPPNRKRPIPTPAPVLIKPPPANRRMSTRGRFVRRMLMALLAGAAILMLERTGVMEHLLGQIGPARFDWNNDYKLVEYLRGAVVDDGLTHDRKDCLLFIINGNDPPDASRLQVMEKHSGTCPGAKGELPKLFTVKVNRLTHTVQTDAGTTGTFHPLP